MSKVYLALYKGRRDGKGFKVWKSRLGDWLTRKLTKGIYSHCEIAIKTETEFETPLYNCYSASVRDGGVRQKTMPLPREKWDLIELDNNINSVINFYLITQNQKYDWLGALGVVLKIPQNRQKYFCSEWCWEALGGKAGWRFSPNDLAVLFKTKT